MCNPVQFLMSLHFRGEHTNLYFDQISQKRFPKRPPNDAVLVRKRITIANKESKLLKSIQVVEAPQKSLLELLSAKNRIAKGLKVRTISIPHTFCKPEPGERGGGAIPHLQTN